MLTYCSVLQKDNLIPKPMLYLLGFTVGIVCDEHVFVNIPCIIFNPFAVFKLWAFSALFIGAIIMEKNCSNFQLVVAPAAAINTKGYSFAPALALNLPH